MDARSRSSTGWRAATAFLMASTMAACGSSPPEPSPSAVEEAPAVTTTETVATTTTTDAPSTTTTSAPSIVEVRYRLERRTADDATGGFEAVVRATLADPRGWTRASFRLVHDPQATFVVVLAEGSEVDELCRPYETNGKYSCQIGPVVALNADRWRTATPKWTGDLATYRQMLVNHEVGHLLGQHHPKVQCPKPGQPAPVMAQQSTELDGCLPNPWPLGWEIELAARHEEPLAPPFERR